jgi:hypothetical protein
MMMLMMLMMLMIQMLMVLMTGSLAPCPPARAPPR